MYNIIHTQTHTPLFTVLSRPHGHTDKVNLRSPRRSCRRRRLPPRQPSTSIDGQTRTRTTRSPVACRGDACACEIVDCTTTRTSSDTSDIRTASGRCGSTDGSSDSSASRSHVCRSDNGKARCHCERANDNEDHRAWQSSSHTENICEACPANIKSVRLSQSSFVRSYLAVRQFVIVEIRRGRESLVADLTHVRFLARMDSTMRVERRGCRERLRANVTGMWLLACVSSNVSSEKRRAIERLETRLALPHATFSLFVDTQRLQRLSRRVC